MVGCDGSGKSTLVSALRERLAVERPVVAVYVGQSSGRIAEHIGALPLVGRTLARFLKRRAGRVHARVDAAPGAATALVIYLLSCWRAYKFGRLLARTRRGTLVLADRWPQAEVPGFHFDGAELPRHHPAAGVAHWLAAREARLYRRMAAHVPMLVIRLTVDLATARARKPDHAPDVLAAKITTLPHLNFNGARICDLDGRTPAASVLEAALHAIHAALAEAAP